MKTAAFFLMLAASHVAGATAQRWAPASIASDQYESTPTFSPDGRELYFMRSDRQFRQWKILESRCERGAWSQPQPVSFAAKAPALDADPFVSADGQRFYFVSTRQNAGVSEELDIWMARRRGDGWGEPERLPEPVNSSGSELLPRETSDGKLYFGSDRAGGHGEGDIYIATRGKDGSWNVENAGPPLSSSANEYEVDVTPDGKYAVVVADRGTRSHLYRYGRRGGAWVELGQVPADDSVFQVGPLMSPRGDRLLFAQRDGEKNSGEFYLIDLAKGADKTWPASCENL